MKIRTSAAALAAFTVLSLTAACGTGTDAAAPTSSAASTSTSAPDTSTVRGPGDGGPGGGVEVTSVSTEAELVALVQDACGDGALDLHRGHQPVQDVLDEVLAISHDELHVRMEEQGQNLAAVATDLGIDPQTLVDALVESRMPAVDGLLASGTLTETQAEQYRAALGEAFTFRTTWNGSDAMPTFAGLGA